MTKHITMVFNLHEFSDDDLDRLADRAEVVLFSNLQEELRHVTAKMHIFQEGLQQVVANGGESEREIALQFLREGLNYGENF